MKTEIVANDKSYKIIIEWKKAPPEKWLAIKKVAESIEAYINGESIPLDEPVMQKIAGIIKELEEQYDNGAPLTPYGENFKEGYLKALHHIRLKINDSNFSA